MSEPPICKICGKLCSAHTVQIKWGIAQAGTYDADGRFDSCSARQAEYEHNWGRRSELQTLVRSLRWRAGRLRTQNSVWTADDLDERANKAVKIIEMLEGHVELYYPWAETKERQ